MNRCGCSQEDERQSPHSPCVVDDAECIAYFLVDPDGFREQGIRELSKSKLISGSLSICRLAHSSASIVENHVVKPLREKAENRAVVGALLANCGEVRSIPLGQSEIGAFCIIDAGLDGYIGHAHLAFSKPADLNIRSHRLTARGRLMDLLCSNRRQLDDLNYGLQDPVG